MTNHTRTTPSPSQGIPRYILAGCILAALCLLVSAGTSPKQAIAQQSGLPSHESLPTSGESYAGSGVYSVESTEVMSSAVQAEQQVMASNGVDVSRLVGLRLGDVIFKLKSGEGKRASFYERGAYHELNGQVALGSLVLTSLKDGRLVLGIGPKDYYQLSPTQVDSLLGQPVAGEGGDTTLTFGGLLRAGTFDNTPILNVDASKAAAVLAKYEGKLVTQGFAGKITVGDLPDANFAQQMLPANPATGMRVPTGAHDALLRLFNNDEAAIVRLIGLPVSPYFVIETKVNGTLKKVGVLFTERQLLTYNPDNDEVDRWQIGLFGSRIYDALENTAAPATATPTLGPTSTATASPTDTPAPTPIFAGISYDHPLPEMPWFAGFDLDVLHYPDLQPMELSDPRKLAIMVLTTIAHQQNKDPGTLEQELTASNGKLDSFVSLHKIKDTYIADPTGDPRRRVPGSLVEKRAAPLDLSKKIMILESMNPPPGGEVLTLNAPFFSPGIDANGQLSFYHLYGPQYHVKDDRGVWGGWELADQVVVGFGLELLGHVNDYSWPDKEEMPYIEYWRYTQPLFPADSFENLFTPWGTRP